MSTKPPSRSVFVGNIPYNLPETEIKELFSGCGEVLSFRLVIDKDTGRGKGFGFVEFPNIESAETAVRNLNNHDIQGRKLRVDFSNDSGGDDDVAPPTNYQHQQPQSNGVSMTGNHFDASIPSLPPGVDIPLGMTCPDAISRTIATLPPLQTLDVLSQMKVLATTNPAQATELLQQAPQLSYAIFQSLLLMGLVSPEALAGVVEAAASGGGMAQPGHYVPPPGSYPPGYPPPPPHMSGQLGMGIGTPPVQGLSAYPPPPPQRSVPAQPPPAPVSTDQEKLLQQVMAMPQHVIDQLPPTERAQIMELKSMYGR